MTGRAVHRDDCSASGHNQLFEHCTVAARGERWGLRLATRVVLLNRCITVAELGIPWQPPQRGYGGGGPSLWLFLIVGTISCAVPL